jgi:hypothetical protein
MSFIYPGNEVGFYCQLLQCPCYVRPIQTGREFSMTLNCNIVLCFSDQNHLRQLSYLVCISCKIFIRWRFNWKFKKINWKSRRVRCLIAFGWYGPIHFWHLHCIPLAAICRLYACKSLFSVVISRVFLWTPTSHN